MARVPYLDPGDLPADDRPLLDTLADDESDAGDAAASDAAAGDPDGDADDTPEALRGDTRNVYRAMAHNPALLDAFRTYGSTLWDATGLSGVEREFVVLATARAADSRYEWHQHVRVALDEGLAREDIVAVATDRLDRLDPAHAALVAYARRFADGTVDDAVHDRLAAHYDDETVVGVGLLAGFYLGLARLLDALAVDTEVAFVGWELDGL